MITSRLSSYGTIACHFQGQVKQHSITAFLDRETAEIDALIAKVYQAIGYLKEFRTALISAAVTGKIDVRKEAS